MLCPRQLEIINVTRYMIGARIVSRQNLDDALQRHFRFKFSAWCKDTPFAQLKVIFRIVNMNSISQFTKLGKVVV